MTFLQSQGYEIDLLDVTSEGRIDLLHLQELLRKDTILVSVCYVDSELGVRQPIKEIGRLLKEYPRKDREVYREDTRTCVKSSKFI